MSRKQPKDEQIVEGLRFRYDIGLMYHGFLALFGRSRAIWVGLVGVGLAISSYSGYGAPDFRARVLVNAVALLLFASVFYGSPLLTLRRLMRGPTLAGEWEVSVVESGICAKGERAEGTYLWSGFTRFVETTRAFVLKLGKQNLVVIPKSAFRDTTHIDSFRTILEQRIPRKR